MVRNTAGLCVYSIDREMVRNTAGLLISVYNNIGTVLVTPLLQTCRETENLGSTDTIFHDATGKLPLSSVCTGNYEYSQYTRRSR